MPTVTYCPVLKHVLSPSIGSSAHLLSALFSDSVVQLLCVAANVILELVTFLPNDVCRD